MARQYLRTFTLKFGIPNGKQSFIKSENIAQPSNSGSGVSQRELPANALETSDVRFDVSIRRSAKGSGSKSEMTSFRLYNLAPETLAVLQQQGSIITLEAGYDGDNDLLYIGDIQYVSTRRDPPEVITTVMAKDSGYVMQNTRVSFSYSSKISKANIIRDMIYRFDGVAAGTLILDDLEDKYYQNGLSIVGNLRDNFTDICRSEGYSWSLNNGKISVKPTMLSAQSKGFSKLQRLGYKITPDYIKNIDWYYDNDRKLKDQENVKRGITLTTFLLPVTAEGVISVDYEDFTGDYSIIEVTHTLDSWGNSWDTQIQTEGV